MGIDAFIRESNMIEGIDRAPTDAERLATERFFANDIVSLGTVCDLQSVYAPRKPLRNRRGLDVMVGGYVAPPGGPEITAAPVLLCDRVSRSWPGVNDDPWREHCAFEALHPFCDGNGRVGRAICSIWAATRSRCPFSAASIIRRWSIRGEQLIRLVMRPRPTGYRP